MPDTTKILIETIKGIDFLRSEEELSKEASAELSNNENLTSLIAFIFYDIGKKLPTELWAELANDIFQCTQTSFCTGYIIGYKKALSQCQ